MVDKRTRVEVTLGKKKIPRRGDLPAQKKGVLPKGKNRDELERRVRRATPGINFYDLGQKWNGSAWIDIPFSITPDITGIGTSFVQMEPFTPGNWETLRALIFTADPSTWKTAYRKLEYEPAEKYGVDLINHADLPEEQIFAIARNGSRFDSALQVVADTKWTTSGLVPAVALADTVIRSQGAFARLHADYGSFDVKVTNGPTYASPEVAFTWSASAHVFLMPWIANIYGSSNDGVDTDGYLFSAWKPLKRSLWLDAQFDGPETYPALSLQVGPTYSPSFTAAVLAEAKSGGRAVEFDGANYNEVLPSTFPPSVDATLIIDQNIIVAPAPQYVAGCFMGAVEQGGQMFYFWANATFGSSFENTRSLPL